MSKLDIVCLTLEARRTINFFFFLLGHVILITALHLNKIQTICSTEPCLEGRKNGNTPIQTGSVPQSTN